MIIAHKIALKPNIDLLPTLKEGDSRNRYRELSAS